MTVDMRSFLQQIKKSNDLVTVKKKVSTKYEVAAVTAKLDGSKAALFENIKGSKFKLVSNLVGSRDRFAQAIGCKKSNINQKIVRAISFAKKPKTSATAKFFENSSKDISILPIVTHFQNESGPFITSSILYTKNLETKSTWPFSEIAVTITPRHTTNSEGRISRTERFTAFLQQGAKLQWQLLVGAVNR
jgi:UbiD family decarboxylase